jgi:hypothetical protein
VSRKFRPRTARLPPKTRVLFASVAGNICLLMSVFAVHPQHRHVPETSPVSNKGKSSYFIMSGLLMLIYFHDEAIIILEDGANLLSSRPKKIQLPPICLCLTQRQRHRQFRLKVWSSYKSFVYLRNGHFPPFS